MKKPIPPSNNPADTSARWFTRDRLLELFGVTAEQFKTDLEPCITARRDGKGGTEFRADAVMAAAATFSIAAQSEPSDTPPVAPGDEPGRSAALEELRRHKAALAKLELERRQGKLLPREHVRTMLSRFAASLRRCGEVLQRQFGPEALQVLDEYLSEAERAAADVLGEAGESEAAA